MKQLIKAHGGTSPINGLKIRRLACVVYDNATLEIINVAPTHNMASEMATHAFNQTGKDILHDGLSFHDERLDMAKIIGMKLNEFQDFVESNPNHPLCANQ